MKLRIYHSIILFALTAPAFASPTPITTSGKFYIGAFGGGGSSSKVNASQFGTAFYTEANGGPLAVNAFGPLDSESTSFFGGQLGYQAQDIPLHPSSGLTLGPAVELEGYSVNTNSLKGTLSNNTTRLAAHDFIVSYPMSRTVFLANAVLNFNSPSLIVHPYIGFGIGEAIVRIAGATATQTAPFEANVNHYNSNSNDTNSTFAGQIKLGLSYDINNSVSVFADYRWLYLASTHYMFGSTVYPTHVETSNWQVKLAAQRFNLANFGIRIKC